MTESWTLPRFAGVIVVLFLGTFPSTVGAGLVAEFLFEEGSGTTAINSGSVGSAGNGTLTGGIGYSTITPQSSSFSLSLDGSSGGVSVPDAWNYGNQVTLEAWINPDHTDQAMHIWDDFGNPGAALVTDASGQVGFLLSTTTNPGIGTSLYGGSLTAGVWQHVAAVYDSSVMRVYLNGVEVAAASNAGSIIDNTSGQAAFIGKENLTSAAYFDGLIDDLRVFDNALTPGQLANAAFVPELSSFLYLAAVAMCFGGRYSLKIFRGTRT